MKKENIKYWIGLLIFLVILIAVVIDYNYCKIIPNFIFLNEFNSENVESYWQGVIAIASIYMTWLTIRQTSDTYFFEKQSYRQIQKKEAVRHYQELLKEALDIFKNRYDNENESIFAVHIVKNIIELMQKIEDKKENVIEPYQIISLEGALGILKNHFDKVLSKQRNCRERRQDIELIIDILYRSNFFKCNKAYLKELSIYNFSDLLIDIAYFNNTILEDAYFEEVTFYGKETYNIWGLARFCKFNNCIFECDFKFYWQEHCVVEMKDCKLKGLEILPKCKNSLHLNNCIIEGYSNLSKNQFQTLEITNCKFIYELKMEEIEVDSEFAVSDTVFFNGLDFQGSVIRWKIEFKNSSCRGLFYFWNSYLLKKDRIYFTNFYVDDFEVGNLSAKVYRDPSEYMIKPRMCVFGDLFEAEWDKNKNMYLIVRKNI